ncbi:basic proline-rich protein-like [Tachyglossus aculeatus]|uniref:basic proline-rich protein-like n=1 Tax=Tachyglossus aculeatus TaxID=9261 RepID=UPI0018F535B8|nr:basic proline-rich protein-like [Tachyglossus aculeatus]
MGSPGPEEGIQGPEGSVRGPGRPAGREKKRGLPAGAGMGRGDDPRPGDAEGKGLPRARSVGAEKPYRVTPNGGRRDVTPPTTPPHPTGQWASSSRAGARPPSLDHAPSPLEPMGVVVTRPRMRDPAPGHAPCARAPSPGHAPSPHGPMGVIVAHAPSPSRADGRRLRVPPPRATPPCARTPLSRPRPLAPRTNGRRCRAHAPPPEATPRPCARTPSPSHAP